MFFLGEGLLYSMLFLQGVSIKSNPPHRVQKKVPPKHFALTNENLHRFK